jgi:hypothetical protein
MAALDSLFLAPFLKLLIILYLHTDLVVDAATRVNKHHLTNVSSAVYLGLLQSVIKMESHVLSCLCVSTPTTLERNVRYSVDLLNQLSYT